MSIVELFVIAVGLSMDAFAVSVCKGLSTQRLRAQHCVICGLYFGGFQGLMPLVGWLLGVRFQNAITSVDHWIAFVLLTAIGVNMIRESRGDAEHLDDSFQPGAMLPLALATSIDALAVGVSLTCMEVDILTAAGVIGAVAFCLSVLGGLLGRRLGCLFQRRAELAGGIVLILIGVRILIEHLTGG